MTKKNTWCYLINNNIYDAPLEKSTKQQKKGSNFFYTQTLQKTSHQMSLIISHHLYKPNIFQILFIQSCQIFSNFISLLSKFFINYTAILVNFNYKVTTTALAPRTFFKFKSVWDNDKSQRMYFEQLTFIFRIPFFPYL